jgi:hypothetical protein
LECTEHIAGAGKRVKRILTPFESVLALWELPESGLDERNIVRVKDDDGGGTRKMA